jgi:hypothetical protein
MEVCSETRMLLEYDELVGSRSRRVKMRLSPRSMKITLALVEGAYTAQEVGYNPQYPLLSLELSHGGYME